MLVFGYFTLKPILEGRIGGWTPSVGDCITAAYSDADIKNVQSVGCADERAADKVIGVFQYRDKAEFDGPGNPCFDVAGSVRSIFYGKPHNGFILCLAAN